MRQIGLVLRSFQPQLPLSIKLLGTGFELIERGERNGQLCGLDRFQETGCHCLVDAVAPHGLTGLLGQLSVGLPAFVAGNAAIGEVAHIHASTTCSTQHHALQES